MDYDIGLAADDGDGLLEKLHIISPDVLKRNGCGGPSVGVYI